MDQTAARKIEEDLPAFSSPPFDLAVVDQSHLQCYTLRQKLAATVQQSSYRPGERGRFFGAAETFPLFSLLDIHYRLLFDIHYRHVFVVLQHADDLFCE